MRILIDECVDPRVKRLFSEHEVSTVRDEGWDALEDGPLLAIAEAKFNVLLTLDRGLEFQQNLARFQIGIVVVHVAKNQFTYYRSLHESLMKAVCEVGPGQVIHVGT
jgi:predicted nuclease of predicted toxin-antitoxin system